MGRTRTFSLLLCFAVLMPMLALPSARADVRLRDRRDRGGLDIRRVEVVPTGRWTLAAKVTFADPIKVRDLTPPNFLVLDIDHSGNGRSDHWLFIAPYRGHLAIYSHEVGSDHTSCCSSQVRMLGPRTVKIRFPKFDNYTWFQGGHLFRVATSYRGPGCSKRCFDIAPNRGWVINDFTAPRIPRFDLPTVATFEGQARARLKYRVTDQGFSGLDKHRIWIRESGSDAWRNVATRRGGEPRSYTFELEEGQSASVRMSVRDRAGNVTESPTRTVTAPIDDGSAAVGTFFGLWEQRATEGAYRGTEHVSVSPFDELRYEATGTRYCLLFAVGPDYGTAEVSVGDFSYQIDMYSESPDGLHKTCAGFLEPEVRSVVVRPLEGRINVDGVVTDGLQTSGPPSRSAASPSTTFIAPDPAMGRTHLRRYAGALSRL